jgi:hypothetical protein
MWCWVTFGLPWPRCTFHTLTGLPCFTCGATRAVLSLFQADAAAAWRLNPLVTVAIGCVAVFDVYAAAVLSTGSRRLRLQLPSRTARRVLAAAVAVVALGNWAYLLGAR